MARTAADAINELEKVASLQDLKRLIAEVSIEGVGEPTILFSGSSPQDIWFGDVTDALAREPGNVRTIRSLEITQFLDLNTNRLLREKLQLLVGGNPLERGSPSNEFLNGEIGPDGKRIPNGIWDEISARFARETSGSVRVLMSPDKLDGVFAQTELPILLDNPAVTDIEGIPRTHLAEIVRKRGLEGAARAVALMSQINITTSGILQGNTAKYLATNVYAFGDALMDADTRTRVLALADQADPEFKGFLNNALGGMLEGAEAVHASGVPRSLNVLGYVGGLVGLMLVASEAAEAASPAERKRILEEWAVEAAGGEVGGIIGSVAASIALAAVGVAAGPVSLALVLGASIVGGFFGAEVAGDFYAELKRKSAHDRARVLGALSELYFGEDATFVEGRIPQQDEHFAWIDVDTPSAELVEAARDDIAWRYALVKLNPFVVQGVDYQGLHNRHGELDLFDAVEGTGLTNAYLQARADALHTYLGLFAAGEGDPGRRFPGGYGIHYAEARDTGSVGAAGEAVELGERSSRSAQRLFGGEHPDLIQGGSADDMLFGGPGSDILDGGDGGDYLEGGEGDDRYRVGRGDTVFDADGVGSVVMDDVLLEGGRRVGNSAVFASEDGRLRYEHGGDDLLVTRLSDGAAVRILGHRDGELGISLLEALFNAPPTVTTDGGANGEVIHGQLDDTVADRNLLNGWNLPDHILGHAGRDWIYAWDGSAEHLVGGRLVDSAPDTDLVEGGADRDFIHGGAGDDRLHATVVADAEAIENGLGSTVAAVIGSDEGDFVSGQAGDDRLYGSARRDGLFGGDGDDLIYAGGGDDIIDGDRSAAVSVASRNPDTSDFDWYTVDGEGRLQLKLFDYVGGIGNDVVHAGEGSDLVWGGAGDDRIYGEGGDDQLSGDMAGRREDGTALVPGELHGDDLLSGGDGDDALNGNGGNDILFGCDGADWLDGDFQVQVDGDAAFHGDDYLYAGPGNDTLIGNGRSDVLIGGTGDDDLFGDIDGLPAELHGADRLFGDEGRDLLVGQGGDDTLYGGDQDDRLFGDDLDLYVDRGNDSLYGGAGDDQLSGGLGNDWLDGGEGGDGLWGEGGDDVLVGGLGLDYLDGGAGRDTYRFAVGDSPVIAGQVETVADTSGPGNVVDFGPRILRESIRLALAGDAGDLLLGYGNGDTVHLAGGLTGAVSSYRFDGWDATPYQEMLAEHLPDAHFLHGAGGSDLVFGSPEDDDLSGAAGGDRLYGGAGDDIFDGGVGHDILIGGSGDDLLRGGEGSDEYRFHAGHGDDVIEEVNGHDVVHFADALRAHLAFAELGGDLVISRGDDRLTIRNWRAGAIEQLRFADGGVVSAAAALVPAPRVGGYRSVADASWGSVAGTAGDDLLDADGHGLSLQGAGGDDVYRVGSGRGVTVIDDPLGANRLVLTGAHGAATTFGKAKGDLYVMLDDDAVALWKDGLATPPAAVVLPDGSVLNGDVLAAEFAAAGEVGAGSGSDLGSVTATRLAPVEELHFRAMTPAGDVDGDGYDDVLVISNLHHNYWALSDPERVNNAAYIVYGQAGGWSTYPERVTSLYDYGPDPYRKETGQNTAPANDMFDRIVAEALGDVDGDGYADIGLTRIEGDEVRFKIFYGDAEGWGASLEGVPQDRATTVSLFPISEHNGLDYVYVADSMDWDGDGRADLVFSASEGHYPEPAPPIGVVLDAARLRGAELGLDDMRRLADVNIASVDPRKTRYGARAIGDVNGDGFGDLFVGFAPEWRIVYGGPDAKDIALDAPQPGQTTEVLRNADTFGGVLGAYPIGDVNGDGIDDLLFNPQGQREFVVIYGRSDIPSAIDIGALDIADGTQITGLPVDSDGNFDVSAGDVNGDGINDIVIGMYEEFTPNSVANVILGRPGGFEGTIDVGNMDAAQGFVFVVPFLPKPPNNNVGGPFWGPSQVAVADIDGDGIGDVIKTAIDPGDVAGERNSSLHLLRGAKVAEGLDPDYTDGDDTVTIDGPGSYFVYAGSDFVTVRPGPWATQIDTGEGDDRIRVDLNPVGLSPVGEGRLDISAGGGDDEIILDVPVAVSGVRLPLGGINLFGGPGGDTYRVSGDGFGELKVRIDDPSVEGSRNSLVLGYGYGASGVRLALGSLKLTFVGDGLEIHLENFDPGDVLGGPRDIDAFIFEGGEQLTFEELVARGFDIGGTDSNDTLKGTSVVDRINGGAGNDRLSSQGGDDVLDGGTGNDVLDGGAGDDRYTFSLGDGQDILVDLQGTDTLRFAEGVDVSGLSATRDGNDLMLAYSEADAVRIQGWFETPGNKVEWFEFADGSHLGASDVEALLAVQGIQLEGDSSDELLEGTEGADLIRGNGGRDTIYGHGGDDQLFGGEGSDLLVGNGGDDWLDAGTGDDSYLFTPGDGQDTLVDAQGVDAVRFAPGIDPGNLVLSRDANDLIAQYASNDELWIRNWFESPDQRIEQFLFADGGVLTDQRIDAAFAEDPVRYRGSALDEVVLGGDGSDLLGGGSGSDRIYGNGGDDIIYGGAGSDWSYGGAGDDTFWVLGNDAYDHYWGGDGYDRIFYNRPLHIIGLAGDFGPENSVELIQGVYFQTVFGDASDNVLDFSETQLVGIGLIDGGDGDDRIRGTAQNDHLAGANGDDLLFGMAGDDVLEGGIGNDELSGGDGNDTYRYAMGDERDLVRDSSGSDVLRFSDLAHDQLWFERVQDDLVVTVIGSADAVVIGDWYLDAGNQIERLEASDSVIAVNTDIDQLVAAMAAFARPGPGESTLSGDVRDQLSPVLAAVWQQA